jgi:hypothetical protein
MWSCTGFLCLISNTLPKKYITIQHIIFSMMCILGPFELRQSENDELTPSFRAMQGYSARCDLLICGRIQVLEPNSLLPNILFEFVLYIQFSFHLCSMWKNFGLGYFPYNFVQLGLVRVANRVTSRGWFNRLRSGLDIKFRDY